MAEIISFEPDSDNADAGNSIHIFIYSTSISFSFNNYQLIINMEIIVNGIPKEILENTILKELVDSILNDTKGVAIAINDAVIPKAQWSDLKLNQNDKVLFIKATQGG